MATRNRSWKEGQVKPAPERKASAAIRGGQDDPASGGCRPDSHFDVAHGDGTFTSYYSRGNAGPFCGHGGRTCLGEWGKCLARRRCLGYAKACAIQSTGDNRGPAGSRDHQPPPRRAESFGALGMEAGASIGQPERQSAEATGGERAAGVSDGYAGEEAEFGENVLARRAANVPPAAEPKSEQAERLIIRLRSRAGEDRQHRELRAAAADLLESLYAEARAQETEKPSAHFLIAKMDLRWDGLQCHLDGPLFGEVKDALRAFARLSVGQES